MPQRRRFIAGAVCPACNALDRVYIVSTTAEKSAVSDTEEVEQITRICAACGFSDTQPLSGGGGIPRGRPERPSTSPATSQPVRILDPSK